MIHEESRSDLTALYQGFELSASLIETDLH